MFHNNVNDISLFRQTVKRILTLVRSFFALRVALFQWVLFLAAWLRTKFALNNDGKCSFVFISYAVIQPKKLPASPAIRFPFLRHSKVGLGFPEARQKKEMMPLFTPIWSRGGSVILAGPGKRRRMNQIIIENEFTFHCAVRCAFSYTKT